jgi:two-component system response regulator CpxR
VSPEPGRGPILVVEDDRAIREALRNILQIEGYEVEVAVNGREALDRLHAGPPPAMLIVDLYMPVLGGWELCRELGREPQLSALPVVIVSASDDVRGPLPLPQARLLPKPIRFELLLAEVERACR